MVVMAALLLPACKTVPVMEKSTGNSLQPAGKTAQKSLLKVIDFRQLPTLDTIIDDLVKKRVILIGESHERYDHHLGQLEIIKRLWQRKVKLAIGLEQIQQPFQSVLDDYVAGRIDATTMLEKTEYFDRWKFDFRLYEPIFQFAREHRIPLLALNIPTEITRAVGKAGIKKLSAADRKKVPASIDRNVPGYRDRIAAVFGQHPGMAKRNIDNFVEAQLVWDEGMAEAAANYLRRHPDRTLVILAGAGHITEGTGIPQRLKRRLDVPMATVLQLGSGIEVAGGEADYILLPEKQELPATGLIGVILGPADRGMKVDSFAADSRAAAAGLKKGDRIIRIDNRPIIKFADVRLALWQHKPGDKVHLVILRGEGGKAKQLEFDVVLK